MLDLRFQRAGELGRQVLKLRVSVVVVVSAVVRDDPARGREGGGPVVVAAVLTVDEQGQPDRRASQQGSRHGKGDERLTGRWPREVPPRLARCSPVRIRGDLAGNRCGGWFGRRRGGATPWLQGHVTSLSGPGEWEFSRASVRPATTSRSPPRSTATVPCR